MASLISDLKRDLVRLFDELGHRNVIRIKIDKFTKINTNESLYDVIGEYEFIESGSLQYNKINEFKCRYNNITHDFDSFETTRTRPALF